MYQVKTYVKKYSLYTGRITSRDTIPAKQRTTHSKIGGLFIFQKVQIQMLLIYVYLPFQKVKLCTHMNIP